MSEQAIKKILITGSKGLIGKKVFNYLKKKELIDEMTTQGVLFWSSMYIPIIIAMAATQNVKAALSQGSIVIVIGVIVTLFGFLLVPLISILILSYCYTLDHS